MTRVMNILAILLIAPQVVYGKFAMPEIKKVPFERLMANLQRKLEKNKKSPLPYYAFARLHAMAYAVKKSELPSVLERRMGGKDKRRFEPWYGPYASRLPFEVKATSNKKKREIAKAHLEKAIYYYQLALERNRKFMPGKLGLAWAFDQQGKTDKAVALYKAVFEETWSGEKDMKAVFGPNWSIAVETAGYLKKHLDPKKDAKAIGQIKERLAHLDKVPKAISPIVIPLTSKKALEECIDKKSAVPFDLDGTGIVRNWQWIRPTAGWLVYESGDGGVSSGTQLVGSVTFGMFWENGYAVLDGLDDDGDGQLVGSELLGLHIWQDKNSNGVSESGEVNSLAKWGVHSLSVSWQRHSSGIAFNPMGVVFTSGKVRPTYDWVPRSW